MGFSKPSQAIRGEAVDGPGKRIVLLLDGTWNSAPDNTNVWRLSQLVAPRDPAGVQQLCYYTAGVGTAQGEKISGGALGYGLDRDIVAAYRWMMGNYDHGDEVFIFGFSRGAYTARSLAGMIVRCGLLRPGAPLSVEQLFDRYRLDDEAPSLVDLYERCRSNPDSPPAEHIYDSKVLTPPEQRLLRYTRRINIKMIGVWDTVGSLGVPFGNIPGLSRRTMRFHNTRLSTIFENAYHALAIDEERASFAPTLWTKFEPDQAPVKKRQPPKRIVEQRWFIGAHGNVGGGVVNDDLSQLPLDWLMRKAAALGLAYRGELNLSGKEGTGPIFDSFAKFLFGFYRILKLNRRFHRTIDAPEVPVAGGKVISIGETIDASVFERWRAMPDYRPAPLVTWAREKQVQPELLFGTIEAETGKPLVEAPAPVPAAAPAPRKRAPRTAKPK